MKPVFQEEAAQRPDPYLDWEFRTRSGLRSRSDPAAAGPTDRWCSLYIRVKLGPDKDRSLNLKRLAVAVREGQLAEDQGQDGPTIRMSDDERALLDKAARGIEAQPDTGDEPVLRQFFVYRPESLIYADGNYASTELYDVILAGPRIPGLSFAPGDDGEPRPSTFDFSPDIDAESVAIGIIDDGIAFAHERFRGEDGTSRVMAIWLQDVERAVVDGTDAKGRIDPGIAFGRRLYNPDINELLSQHETDSDIYRAVGATDFGNNAYNPLAQRASHGTHVLDVAAGYDPAAPSDRSLAKRRPILAVQLPSIATLDTSGVTMGSYVLQAVRQIMIWAESLGPNIPLVINFSYGLAAGPKDGTHPLERALNELIAFRNKRASTCLVVPAGNSYRHRTTARMTLAPGQAGTLDWIIPPDDPTPNFLEIWLDAEPGAGKSSPIEVSLVPPDGLPGAAARPDKGKLCALTLDGKAIAATYYDIPAKERGRVFIAVNQTATKDDRTDCAPSGRWRLTLENKTDRDLVAHLYIQRDDTPFGYRRQARQSVFDHADAYGRDPTTGNHDRPDASCPITGEETLSALASSPPDKGGRIVVVGAAEAAEELVPAEYTSSGPVRSRPGPDCAAVTEEGLGHWGVLAAGTFGGSVVRMDGTSVAAPQIVRLIANIFQKSRSACVLTDLPEYVREVAGLRDQDVFPARVEDAARLGAFVVQRRPDRGMPQRRYPAKSQPNSNEEITL